MIKFSWKKINDNLDWKAFDVLEYFFLKRGIRVPSYLRKDIPIKVKRASVLPFPKGDCFIKDIDRVLQGAESPNELYLYLELASKRNLFDYTVRKMSYLPTVFVEEHKLPWVEQCSLLKIIDNNIYFKYE